MQPKINKTSEYIEIVGHYDDSVLCAKLTLLADLYAVEHREGYARFRIEDEDKLDLVNEKLDYKGQLKIYSNDGQTLLATLDYALTTCTITSTGTSLDSMGHNYTYSGSQTFLGFSITANATVPDSDLEVGDSFSIASNKTVYIVEGSSSSTVTDLTGTAWEFNNNITLLNSGTYFDIIFGQYNQLVFENNELNYQDINELNPTPVYKSTIGWYNINYKTITITGGTDVTNSDLIAWLQANATQIEPEPTETNTFSLGNLAIANVYFGTLQAKKIYLGNSLVWESGSEPTPENALLAQDGALLVSDGGYLITTEVTLISFTIDGTTYQAEQGMTWSEWCNSEYSKNGTTEYRALNSSIVGVINNIVVLQMSINGVVPTDTIVSGQAYTTYTYIPGGGGSDN